MSGRLRRLSTPSRGIRVDPGVELSERSMLVALTAVLPRDCAFSHATAAHVHGLPLPLGVNPISPVHVCRASAAPPITRRGVQGHAGLERRPTQVTDGLRLTTPTSTWCDVARGLSRARAVAAGDALLRDHQVTREDIEAQIDLLKGVHGVPGLRLLVPLLRPGSMSPKESEARLLFHDHDLPEPELNVDIFDDWGTWLATPDFTWRWGGVKVVGEYDGDQHRTDRTAWQYERDRRARLERNGWTYIEMTEIHLSRPARTTELISRLRSVLL